MKCMTLSLMGGVKRTSKFEIKSHKRLVLERLISFVRKCFLPYYNGAALKYFWKSCWQLLSNNVCANMGEIWSLLIYGRFMEFGIEKKINISFHRWRFLAWESESIYVVQKLFFVLRAMKDMNCREVENIYYNAFQF